jgi:CHAT domain-containing protein
MGQSARPDHPLTQQTRTEFAEVRKRYNQAVATIKKFDPDFIAAVQSEPITYASIQETIPDEHTALIEFFITEDKILAFVVLQQGDSLPPIILPGLAPSHIQDLARRWLHTYATFRTNPAAEWTQWRDTMDATLAMLYDRLFLPLQPLLDAHRIRKLIFITSHALHLFPLHALYIEENGQRRYLIDLYEKISYAPSAAVLHRCQERRRPFSQEVLLVCNPDRAGQYGRPLQHAEREAQRIRAHYPETQVREQEQASSDTVLQEAGNSHVLHLICHGFFDIDQPLHSYLGLFGRRLTLGEIFAKLELSQASLVVLSACETGVVKMSRIDEYVGLPSGFLSAGAPTVISSLWMVDDEATSLLMGKLYENLQAGVSKGRALNDAQRWLRTTVQEKPSRIIGQGQPRFSLLSQPFPLDYSHPFYWAAFCLSGAP